MPTRARFCLAERPADIIPRSKNRQAIFTRGTDHAVLLNEARNIEVLAKVRHCDNTGFMLLTESSKEQLHRPHA